MTTLLDVPALQQALGPDAGRFRVEALAVCDSTNARLLERARTQEGDADAAIMTVLVADQQTQGRGRRGRPWIASPEKSLTFSLLWHAPLALAHLSGLSLGLGLALARALEHFGARDLFLKWPNDLLCRQAGASAKLAGILVEIAGTAEPSGNPVVVAGIGINLVAPDNTDQAAAGLSACCPHMPERALLLAAVLREMARVLDIFADSGFAVALRDAWQRRHIAQDQPVCLLDAGRVVAQGICRGVDADGALLLEEATGIRRHLAGDLSLRPGFS
ncbi:MAG: biotin--[acetyl-CoA-carboxylase] ligase [Zoogloeaceae bacterium]|jgi:BirA family biotin operon repressor/biotin-[acetyl-CoA-carboxylase] ligase|nr:biotin--[acetyl-CoA-carboxylase] ligase [Zoogloeaceae bacterium]